MSILTELRERVDGLAAHDALAVEPEELLGSLRHLGGETAMEVLSGASQLRNAADRLMAVASAVIAELSARERGHGGLAATQGHRSPVSLVQSIAGVTKSEAQRAVRIGESLLDRGSRSTGQDGAHDESCGEGGDGSGTGERPDDEDAAVVRPWHDPLGRAMLHGAITPAHHDAIFRGLGQPPSGPDAAAPTDAVVEVWSLAAQQLIDEAADLPVEELARKARVVRDMLDPVGAEERFARRYDARSFRMWVDGDGASHAHISFDDEMAAWVRSMIDAASRPRRGGPRFVGSEEKAQSADLIDDPRTNDQLAYDLLMDVVRAGSLADARAVFGARQPGVRIVVVKDARGPRDPFGRMLTVGHLEDGGDALPGSVIDRRICESGTIDVSVDSCGNPLDVGREQRLFTTPQRIALAARDGGCVWPSCTMPASYCEAHHCDHWKADRGRTDIDRGVLLCRFHHLLLHNNGWRITRHGKERFVLHPPPGGGDPIVLDSKAAWKWAWDPPPAPARRPWRAA